MTNELDASCRMAFAALLHDLGKFAERAAPAVERGKLDAHITNYCKWHGNGKYPSHRHAAYTALFMDTVESVAPDLIRGDTSPFASRTGEVDDITDSLINAAAMHHRPETLLQWIIATADRVASGFEREEFDRYNTASEEKTVTGRNHYQARLLTLFEQIRLGEKDRAATPTDLRYRYRLKALTPENLFPVQRDGYEPNDDVSGKAEYQQLWDAFLQALQKIPASHRQQWPLWLDHFDTLWQSFTHAIPSATAFGVRPEVSLYDHSKATAAFAVALWRWHVAQDGLGDAEAIHQHLNRADWDEKKFLLVQGDFFGIQDFIFSEGTTTNKNAAKILRGRSFQVSLFTELAALKVLEALALPSTSQITNAAGKFLIVAPNTKDTREKLKAARNELNKWFLREMFGLSGLGLVAREASCDDFLAGHFDDLVKALFADLERAKLGSFDLTTGDAPTVFAVDYPLGVCRYNDRLPADKLEGENKASAALSRDQITIGKALAHQDRLLVARDGADWDREEVRVLEVPIFGYRVGFAQEEKISGKFGELVRNGQLLRCWDFSLPEKLSDTLWDGYARRYINAYVPFFDESNLQTNDKYQGVEDDDEDYGIGVKPKTFSYLACEDRFVKRTADGQEKWVGQIALTTLKGDVDNLGKIFRQGLGKNTFAKMAALSRQMNAFFAVWLPAFCRENYPDCYTVFAGGDDFFLIGPWHSTQKLTADMAEQFRRYAAENQEIHFSAGMAISKPKQPVHTLAELAEKALEKAKGYETDKTKNAVCLYDEVVSWLSWGEVAALEEEIQNLADRYKLSTSYIYGLLHLIKLAEDRTNLESAMWRSRFAYRTRRYVVDKLDKGDREGAQRELTEVFGKAIADHGGKFRIPLFNYFYSARQGGRS